VQFSEAAEYRALIKNEVSVTMLYSGMLRRAPDAGGFDSWVNALDSGTSVQELINLFLVSEEYHNRFLPTVVAAGAPLVKRTWPPHMASNVSVLIPLTVMFSKPMDPATLNAATFRLTDPIGATVAAQCPTAQHRHARSGLAAHDGDALLGDHHDGRARPERRSSRSNYSFAFLTQGSEGPPIVAGCPTRTSMRS
jgi:hypothetical protein